MTSLSQQGEAVVTYTNGRGSTKVPGVARNMRGNKYTHCVALILEREQALNQGGLAATAPTPTQLVRVGGGSESGGGVALAAPLRPQPLMDVSSIINGPPTPNSAFTVKQPEDNNIMRLNLADTWIAENFSDNNVISLSLVDNILENMG